MTLIFTSGKLIINDIKKTTDNNILFITDYIPFDLIYIEELYKKKSILIGGMQHKDNYYYKYLKYKQKYLSTKKILNL
jgi:hypothetical protein